MASFKVSNGGESYRSALALFINPTSTTDIERIDFIDHQPTSQIGPETSVVEFNISGASSGYIDLNSTRLHVKLRLVRENGKPISKQDKVSLVNLPLHSLWSQLDVCLQNQNVSPNVGQNYAYKSYLDVLLKSDPQLLQAQLTSQLFYMDESHYMDTTQDGDVLDDSGKVVSESAPSMNSGYKFRSSFTENGEVIDLEGPLYADLCQQDKFILQGVPIKVKLWKQKDSFCLMSGTNQSKYKVEITEAILKVATVFVNPGILVGHGDLLKKHMATYPFMRSDIKCFSVPKGQFNITLDNLYQGLVPTSLTVGLVSSKAYSGFYDKNPFNFHHYHCNFCGFFVDSQSVPGQPFQPNYTNNS